MPKVSLSLMDSPGNAENVVEVAEEDSAEVRMKCNVTWSQVE